MKIKLYITAALLAALAASCTCSDRRDTHFGASSNDSAINRETIEVVEEDPAGPQEQYYPKMDEASPENAKEEVPMPEAREDNGLDAEVNKIISLINKRTEAVNFMKGNGTPSASSMALRTIESFPDYEKRLRKIKHKLTPEQKARINKAERRYLRAVDEWENMPPGY